MVLKLFSGIGIKMVANLMFWVIIRPMHRFAAR